MKATCLMIITLFFMNILGINYTNSEAQKIGSKLKLEDFLHIEDYTSKQAIILYELDRDSFTYPINIYKDGDKIIAIGLRIFNKNEPVKRDIEQKILSYLFVEKYDLEQVLKEDKVKITYNGLYNQIDLFKKIIELSQGKKKKKKDLQIKYIKDSGYIITMQKDIERMEIIIPEYKVKF